MPRNGLGNYSLPFTNFVPDTTISINAVNGDLNDIALAITETMAADGQTVMEGPLQVPVGTIGSPSLTFASSLFDGFFLQAAHQIGVASQGALGGSFSASGFSTNTGVNALLQAGAVMDFAGASAPPGWLLCGGQAVSRVTYSALFAVIGTSYGNGDGSLTFNVPDCRGRGTYGVDNMGGTPANRITAAGGNFDGTILGNSGGLQNHQLLTSEIISHTHVATVNDSGHPHNTTGEAIGAPNNLGGSNFSAVNSFAGIGLSSTGITVNNTNNVGDQAHTVLNPAIILNKIICTGGQ